MQIIDLIFQQGDRIVRVLQIWDKISRGAAYIARDIRILYE
jgi:hypothetical protein